MDELVECDHLLFLLDIESQPSDAAKYRHRFRTLRNSLETQIDEIEAQFPNCRRIELCNAVPKPIAQRPVGHELRPFVQCPVECECIHHAPIMHYVLAQHESPQIAIRLGSLCEDIDQRTAKLCQRPLPQWVLQIAVPYVQ